MIAKRNINVTNYKEVKNTLKYDKSEIMCDAWYYVRKFNDSLSNALKTAWRRAKMMMSDIVEKITEIERNAAFNAIKFDSTPNAETMTAFYNSSCYKGD